MKTAKRNKTIVAILTLEMEKKKKAVGKKKTEKIGIVRKRRIRMNGKRSWEN